MKITYKYKIGQKVKLTKVRYLNSYYLDEKDQEELLNKEVTIINRGFDYSDSMCGGPLKQDKLKLTIFYYIAEDPTEEHKTMYYEDVFEGEVFNEVVDEKPLSADGVEVEFGTKLYDSILVRSDGKLCVNCKFVFASEGPCVRISKNYRHWDSSYEPKKEDEFTFESCRTFLCQMNIDGKIYECGDARRYGNRTTLYSDDTYTKLPDNFAELYVDTALDKDYFYGRISSIYDGIFAWEIEQWLRHFGVWEQVKTLYDSRVPQEPEPEKPEESVDDKLNQLLAGLSEEERKKLKEML